MSAVSADKINMKAIIYGLLASFFFAFAFIFNRSMELDGGYWAWSASLRYFFMLPLLLALVRFRGGHSLASSLRHLREHLPAYLLWSTVGFGLFYAPVCFGAAYGQGWLLAATWQVTIIAGPLMTPLLAAPAFSARIPWRAMRWSLLILVGIFLMQLEHARAVSGGQALYCVLPVLLAAFMYPLGNRKMMAVCRDGVDTFQRVLNMTIASQPFWLALAAWALWDYGPPSAGQAAQSLLVAVFSGVVATLLFFAATNLVRRDQTRLAAVEATQSGEILFALLGELILLAAPLPSEVSFFGMGLVVVGMLLHSLRRG